MNVNVDGSMTSQSARSDSLDHSFVTPTPPTCQVTVIVPVYNDRLNLKQCLDALNRTSDVEFEVIVVDDGSSDDSAALARSMGAQVIELPRQGGPARARNRGVELAAGQYILFIDADVCVRPTTVAQFVELFQREPDVAAIFGSYDTQPLHKGLVSQYKNLLHHFVHQNGNRDASTFWAGCGAIRREVFLQVEGFDTGYARPCIEDIELGVRLKGAGHKIVLDRDIQVTHCKRWTLLGMVRTDIFSRAIPWTNLILRSGKTPNDLNLKTSQRVSAMLSCCLLMLGLVGAWFEPWLLLIPCGLLCAIFFLDRWTTQSLGETVALTTFMSIGVVFLTLLTNRFGWWMTLPGVLLSAITILNLKLFRFFARVRQPMFAVAVLPLHILYFIYSAGVFGSCLVWHRLGGLFYRAPVGPGETQ